MLPAEPSGGVRQSARGYPPTICRSHAPYATRTTTNASEIATVPNGGCHLPPKGLNGPLDPTVYRRRASKKRASSEMTRICLLYTSDAADDLTRVDLGGRR